MRAWVIAALPLILLTGPVTATNRSSGPIIINQTSHDITLLSASVFGKTVGSAIPLNRCDKVFSSDRSLTYDCKKALESRFKMPLIQPRAYVQATQSNTSGNIYPTDGHDTPLILIRLIARESAFRDSDSLGFYITNPKGILYFAKAAVRTDPPLMLKDGTRGVPLSFLALFPQSASDNDAKVTRSIGFKPFIDFHKPAEGRIFRNWDIEPTEGYDNYLLIKGYDLPLRDILSIDRRSEVLAGRGPSIKPPTRKRY